MAQIAQSREMKACLFTPEKRRQRRRPAPSELTPLGFRGRATGQAIPVVAGATSLFYAVTSAASGQPGMLNLFCTRKANTSPRRLTSTRLLKSCNGTEQPGPDDLADH